MRFSNRNLFPMLVGLFAITAPSAFGDCGCDESNPPAPTCAGTTSDPDPTLDVCTCDGEKIVIRWTSCDPQKDDRIALYKQNTNNQYTPTWADSYQFLCGGASMCNENPSTTSGVVIFSNEASLPQSFLLQTWPFTDNTYMPIYETYELGAPNDIRQVMDASWAFQWSETGSPSLTMSVSCMFPFEDDVASSCNDPSTPKLYSDESKPSLMKFIYNGGNCEQSWNMQESNPDMCSDTPGNEPPLVGSAKIVVEGRRKTYFDGTVSVGETFYIESVDDVDFNVMIYDEEDVLMQAIEIRVGVSAFIAAGDTFGSIGLVEFNIDGKTARSFGTPTYTAEICNEGSGVAKLDGLKGYYGNPETPTDEVDLSGLVSSVDEVNVGACASINIPHGEADMFNIDAQLTKLTVEGSGAEATSTVGLNPLTQIRAGLI